MDEKSWSPAEIDRACLADEGTVYRLDRLDFLADCEAKWAFEQAQGLREPAFEAYRRSSAYEGFWKMLSVKGRVFVFEKGQKVVPVYSEFCISPDVIALYKAVDSCIFRMDELYEYIKSLSSRSFSSPCLCCCGYTKKWYFLSCMNGRMFSFQQEAERLQELLEVEGVSLRGRVRDLVIRMRAYISETVLFVPERQRDKISMVARFSLDEFTADEIEGPDAPVFAMDVPAYQSDCVVDVKQKGEHKEKSD